MGGFVNSNCLQNKPSAHPTTILNRKGMEIKAWHVLLARQDSVSTILPQPPLLDLPLCLMLWIMLKLSFAVLSTDLFLVLQRWGSAFEALWHIQDEWIQSKCSARMRISASLLFISLIFQVLFREENLFINMSCGYVGNIKTLTIHRSAEAFCVISTVDVLQMTPWV